jgi:hypothetical protein
MGRVFMQIGELLMSEGVITSAQLADALEKQKKEPGKKLGEILLELEYINIETFTKMLDRQMREQGLIK